MTGTEATIGNCAKCTEDTSVNVNSTNTHANTAVIYAKDSDGSVTLDQNEYIKLPRSIHHREPTGADAEAQASKVVTDMSVSLRGALACALSTQVWLL
eukprot:7794005-Pyramimonas_sp.AAC.1